MTYAKREPTQHELLQGGVVKLLSWTGWRHLHVRRSVGHGKKWTTTTNIKGWPDLAPVWSGRQPGRFLAIEVKIPPDWLSEDQADVMAQLVAAGMECIVVVPSLTTIGNRSLPDGVTACDPEMLAKLLGRR